MQLRLLRPGKCDLVTAGQGQVVNEFLLNCRCLIVSFLLLVVVFCDTKTRKGIDLFSDCYYHLLMLRKEQVLINALPALYCCGEHVIIRIVDKVGI